MTKGESTQSAAVPAAATVVSATGLTMEDLAKLINNRSNAQTLLLNDIRSDINVIRSDVNSCLSNLEAHNARIDEVETKTTDNSRAIRETNENVKAVREDLLSVSIQMEFCLQRQLRNSFEIIGVPLSNGENVVSLIISLMKLLDVKLTESDINSCYRAGFQPRTLNNGQTVYPSIFLDLLRETSKIQIITKLKARNGFLTSVDLGMNDVALSTIYINERLTAYMKNIDKHARKAKKDGLLKYVWPKNGIIHGRVDDGSQVLNFYSVDDVLNATSNLTPNANNPAKNINLANVRPVRLVDPQPDITVANPNERQPKRKTAGESAEESADLMRSDDHQDDISTTRSSQRINKKSKKDNLPK